MSYFNEVYNLVKFVPKGKVITYGYIAKLTGRANNSRIVGFALHANPYPNEVPCHRVVNKKGELSRSFAFGGFEKQKELLGMEGIEFDNEGKVDLKKYIWDEKNKYF